MKLQHITGLAFCGSLKKKKKEKVWHGFSLVEQSSFLSSFGKDIKAFYPHKSGWSAKDLIENTSTEHNIYSNYMAFKLSRRAYKVSLADIR